MLDFFSSYHDNDFYTIIIDRYEYIINLSNISY